MSDTYTISRSTVVDAPPDQVYRRIADFHEWEAWSPWEDIDPDQQRTYSGADSGVGAVYGWSGNRARWARAGWRSSTPVTRPG